MNTGGELELLLSCAWLAAALWLIIRAIDQRRLFSGLEPSSALLTEHAPHVTIIVPVRDESSNIAACLQSLLRQRYPASRLVVLVVDDESTDDTALIVQALAEVNAHLQLLHSPALPRGTTGKSHACWIGAQSVPADTEWLCFLDADVRADPVLLASAVHLAGAEKLDLLSLAPRHELRSFAERLILPCGMFTLAFSQDLRERQAQDGSDVTVSGPFLLIRRRAYDVVGGHAAVGSAIAEDVALARILKRHGFKVVLRSGDRLLSARMYTGWRTVWPGLAKNLVDTLGGPASALITAFIAVPLAWAAFSIPALDAVGCLGKGESTACFALAPALSGSAAALALHFAGAAYFRIPLWYALLFPLGYSAGALMVLDSVRRRLYGRVRWKGRAYP
ncbi:MAG TPA: glycosyltransferase family A protein [Xanthobacteraceae bacterium]|nr:glycosyltransferase family A protein [Xanthobacteraceae bacterium]